MTDATPPRLVLEYHVPGKRYAGLLLIAGVVLAIVAALFTLLVVFYGLISLFVRATNAS